MKNRSKVVVLRNSGSFVRRKDGDVRIKMFRGIILQGERNRVISPETIECEIRIIYFRKAVIQVILVKEKEMRAFEGDLFFLWMEENSPVIYLVNIHSECEFVMDQTCHFKVNASLEVSEWVEKFFRSSSEALKTVGSCWEIEKVLPMIPREENGNTSEIRMNVEGQ